MTFDNNKHINYAEQPFQTEAASLLSLTKRQLANLMSNSWLAAFSSLQKNKRHKVFKNMSLDLFSLKSEMELRNLMDIGKKPHKYESCKSVHNILDNSIHNISCDFSWVKCFHYWQAVSVSYLHGSLFVT